MLALSPLRNSLRNGQEEEEKGKADFSVDNILDTFDFDESSFFDGLLPDLQMDREIFSDFLVPELTAVAKSTGEENNQQTKKPVNQLGNKKLKKPKVDWTPELHRRFVQAVEKLGFEKAVPSRILQLMGTANLTRHNVASHLQKYRSHQKHMLARGAEAARWNQRGGAGGPPADFRHLHVWGHPSSIDKSFICVWPSTSSQLPPLIHHHIPTLETPCFPTRFQAAPASRIPGLAPAHPSVESVDAAIGEVLSKPWMPMPLGLNPPSVDSVIAELQRQGVSKIPLA